MNKLNLDYVISFEEMIMYNNPIPKNRINKILRKSNTNKFDTINHSLIPLPTEEIDFNYALNASNRKLIFKAYKN